MFPKIKAQYNGNWYPPTFGKWIVPVRVGSAPQKNKIMSLKNEFQTIYIKIIDVNSADYGI